MSEMQKRFGRHVRVWPAIGRPARQMHSEITASGVGPGGFFRQVTLGGQFAREQHLIGLLMLAQSRYENLLHAISGIDMTDEEHLRRAISGSEAPPRSSKPSGISASPGGGAPPSLTRALTQRQRQIMDCVLAGQPNKNIAADLNISQRTVENHRAAVMRRSGATSLPALARMAIGAGCDADRKPCASRAVVAAH